MSTEDNKALARRAFDALNSLSILEELTVLRKVQNVCDY